VNAIVMLSPDDLRALVTEAVAEALAVQPALLDRTGLAKALSCSPSHVDNLRKSGLPTVYLGDAPRFVLNDVLAWVTRARYDQPNGS
jgi:hypothetical protein